MTRDEMISNHLSFWHDLGYYAHSYSRHGGAYGSSQVLVDQLMDERDRLHKAFGAEVLVDGQPVSLSLDNAVLLLRSRDRIDAVPGEHTPFSLLATWVQPDIEELLPHVELEDPEHLDLLPVRNGSGYKRLFLSLHEMPLLQVQYQQWLSETHPALVDLPDEWVWEALSSVG